MKFNIKELDQLIADNYVMKQKHPMYDLWIYNYTQKTQYGRYWNDTTLKCRGLVLDIDGNVIAKSFDKFFNLEELNLSEIPKEPIEVFEKMDGSLILIFYYNSEWIFASKGSFTSEQAAKAKELFEKEKDHLEFKITSDFANKNHIYICEVIYPSNRIVCDYGDDEKLVLLAVLDKSKQFQERFHIENIASANVCGFELVKKYDYNQFNSIKYLIEDNREGFVIRFKNGFRMKVKGDEYVRLHRIVTHVSSKVVWEYLKDNLPFDELLDRVPDEFYNWVKDTLDDLKLRYVNIYFDSNKIYGEIIKTIPIRDTINHRKAFSDQAMGYKNMFGLLFAIYDGKEDIIRKIIFEKIKPKFERPFEKQ